MYYKAIVKIPKNSLPEIEPFFYDIFPFGWEEKEGKDKKEFIFYLEEKERESLQKLKELTAKYEDIETEVLTLEEKDWAEIWKINFKPLKIGKKLVVLPPWEENVFKERIPVIIEPGLAFGTGHHPTTQMMLEEIEKFAFQNKNKDFIKILDLGCGTGILSIASALLFPKSKIFAVDIDEEATRATIYNTKLNNIKNILVTKEIPKEEKFDLILANIGFKVLKKLAEELKKYAKASGTVYLLSGIIKEDVDKLKKYYQSLGYNFLYSKTFLGWGLLSFKFSS